MAETAETRVAFGVGIVEQAGRLALSFYHAAALSVASKGPGDVVTEADFAIERMVRQAVAAAFPDDRFIGEEFGGEASDAGFTWLLDPVDGTVNYARHVNYFCVSLALLQASRPIAAWILDPVEGELFWAGPDGRARLGETPIRCISRQAWPEAVIGLGFSTRHDRLLPAELIGRLGTAGAEFRRLGAGALCLAHVAAGRLDAYVEPHMNPWDAIGGLYIAACAGAVTLDYLAAGGLQHGAPVFAAAPAIAAPLLELLPAPFSDTPLHRENVARSAGVTAT
ncbi:MAG: inositol monophosphatase family protein [Devosia sp.]|nr:inositol monophosphatase family protein [Devosia sp.]